MQSAFQVLTCSRSHSLTPNKKPEQITTFVTFVYNFLYFALFFPQQSSAQPNSTQLNSMIVFFLHGLATCTSYFWYRQRYILEEKKKKFKNRRRKKLAGKSVYISLNNADNRITIASNFFFPFSPHFKNSLFSSCFLFSLRLVFFFFCFCFLLLSQRSE